MRRLLRWTALFPLVLVAAAACGGDDDGGDPTGPGGGDTPEPASIALSDDSLVFAALGDSAQLAATVSDADGNAITGAALTWTSTDTDVATVSAAGWVVAVAEGTAQVVVRTGTVADTAAVMVEQAGAGVSVSTESVALHALGDSVQLTAVVRDANDNEIAGAAVQWASSDTAVATVSEAGWVVAKGNGTAEVVASSGEGTDTVAVEVAQVAAMIVMSPDTVELGQDDTVRIEAVVADSNGMGIEGLDVDWTSADETVATVDDAGLVTAVRAGGKTVITATSGALSGETAVRVLDQIAFQRDGDIYIMNEDGTGATPLTNGPADDKLPVWSPDGSKLAFASDGGGNSEVYVIGADGTGLVNVSNHAASYDREAVWSPDGTKLVFVSDRDGNNEIYVVNADGSDLMRLTDDPADDRYPAWSPDGSKVAFTTNRDGNYEVYVMNANGTGLTNLTNDPDVDYGPAWSPDGSKILFVSDRDGREEIYVMNADGSGATNLTNSAGADDQPVRSPDGTKIAFRSDRDGNVEIYVMNADGTGAVNVSNDDAANDETPTWSADGERVLFRSDRDGNDELYIVGAGGGTPTNLTNTPVPDSDPAWRPRPRP
ncbi:MAG TPA: LpqB family beta-propeller domain-containing protein [Longimicrobiales bacterium]